MGSRISHVRRSLVTLAAAAAIAVTSLAAPVTAQALPLDRSGWEAVPRDDVDLDYPLHLEDASFSTTRPDIFTQGTLENGQSAFGGNSTPYHAVFMTYPSTGTVPGSVTFKWSNCGTDADGDAIDLELTLSNIRVDRAPNRSILICSDDTDEVTENGLSLFKLVLKAQVPLRVDVHASITKHGTSTAAEGNFLFQCGDIDIPYKADPDKREGISLGSGFGNTVYVDPNTQLVISEDNTRFLGPESGANYSNDPRYRIVTAVSDNADFNFTWQGMSCGTTLFSPFNDVDNQITATSGAGGSISDDGITVVRWKNDMTYVMTPSEGYVVKDVVVDGVSVGPVESYTFKSVTGDHTIHVDFERARYTVIYVSGTPDAPGGTVYTERVYHGDDVASVPDVPARDGYEPLGWDDDGTDITSDRTIYPVYRALLDVDVTPVQVGSIAATDLSADFGGTRTWRAVNNSKVPVRLTGICLYSPDGYVGDTMPADFVIADDSTHFKGGLLFDDMHGDSAENEFFGYGGDIVLMPGGEVTFETSFAGPLTGLSDRELDTVIRHTYASSAGSCDAWTVSFLFEEATDTVQPSMLAGNEGAASVIGSDGGRLAPPLSSDRRSFPSRP